jgi:uncharacterized protein YtpQ (UPF0354 family)
MMKSTLAQLGEKRPLKIDDIVPLIKGSKWLAESDSQGMNVHRENVAADLFVVYGEDGPDYLRFVNRDAYAELGLSAKVMRATALDNLRARLPKIERFGEGPVYMLAAGGTFESSLLLMPEVWKDVDEAVDGRVIAATPSRDLLMFTGENALEAISEMRQMAEKIHRDGNYLVSKELLMLSDGVWERLPSPDDVPKLRLESQTAP